MLQGFGSCGQEAGLTHQGQRDWGWIGSCWLPWEEGLRCVSRKISRVSSLNAKSQVSTVQNGGLFLKLVFLRHWSKESVRPQ